MTEYPWTNYNSDAIKSLIRDYALMRLSRSKSWAETRILNDNWSATDCLDFLRQFQAQVNEAMDMLECWVGGKCDIT